MKNQPTVLLPAALPVLGTDRNGFNHWFRMGRSEDGSKVWRTKFKPVSPPAPRELTRDNCLEIAFFLRLQPIYALNHKAALAATVGRTENWLERARTGDLGNFWIFDPDRRMPRNDGFLNGKESLEALALLMRPLVNVPAPAWKPLEASEIIIINVAEIVRRVDALFEAAG